MPSVRFSLIHPSRGRVNMARETIAEWRGAASGRCEYEYLLSIDADDPNGDAYAAMAKESRVDLLVNRNRSMVDAVNRAAQRSTGDVLIVVSDDFGCPPEWDLAIAAAIGDRKNIAVLVDDAIEGRIMTLPIVDRAFYESAGHVYHPDYISMFSDDDLTEHARQSGRLIETPGLTFPHRHPQASGAELDDTYRRQGRPLAWIEGRRVLARRRAMRFGAAPKSAALTIALARIDITAAWQRAGSRIKRRLLGLPPP